MLLERLVLTKSMYPRTIFLSPRKLFIGVVRNRYSEKISKVQKKQLRIQLFVRKVEGPGQQHC